MPDIRSLLLIDDNPAHAEAFQEALLNARDGPFHGEWVQTLSQSVERLREKTIWAIFASLSLPDSQGLDTIDRLLQAAPGVPILVMGRAEDEDLSTEALRRGAKDYLLNGHIGVYSFGRAIRNMAERKTAEEALFNEKERATVTLNSIGDAVLSTDILGNVSYLNVVAEKMTGWTCAEALGRPLGEVFQIIDGATRKSSPNPMEFAIHEDKTVKLTPNCILIRRDGSESSIEDSAAPIHDRSGLITGAVIVFHDVTESRAMAEEMSHLAQHDILTDLPNRLLLKDRISQAIVAASRNDTKVAVLFLDLDGFKEINDSLGHSVGDKLLQSVAERLSACVRKSDTVSRRGGDEFVILLSEVAHAADAAISAAKIIAELKKAHKIGRHRLRISASVGLSTYPNDGEDAETLIKNADTAMYEAKQSGREKYRFFRSQMSLQAVERQSLEEQLRCALERQELLLHYQPKVNLKTGAITGVEALLRWQHPQRGLLLPRQFMTIAEDTGMIIEIGQWVLREACTQMREWLEVGLLAVPVAVNISALEFRSGQFVQRVQDALKSTCLDPKFIELELTESGLMQHTGRTAQTLSQLKAIGIQLAIDDFGVGYSSLSYLTRFPIDTLKLDQSFLNDIIVDSDRAIIVDAVVRLGRSLKKKVIAEGVETPEQLRFILGLGCDEAQGYYFSSPVVAEQFAKLVETGLLIPLL
jgi:diguanylate cyclase (GGDEF)-like protein/PAS domain S-box-containing protein